MTAQEELPKELTDEQKTAALVTYLFAVLMWEPGSNENGWYGYCAETYCGFRDQRSFAASIWWSMRHEEERPDEDWLGYLAYVCKNHRLLSW